MTETTHNAHAGLQDDELYKQLQSLEARRLEVGSKLAEGSLQPAIEALYSKALEQTDSEINAVATSPILQTRAAELATNDELGIAQLAPLRNILPEQEIENTEQLLLAQVGTIRAFFEKYGTHTSEAISFMDRYKDAVITAGIVVTQQTVEQPLVHDEQPRTALHKADSVSQSAVKPETVKQRVQINMHNKAIAIGTKGRIVKYSGSNRDGQRDYADECKTSLKYLTENQDREISAMELWGELAKQGLLTDCVAQGSVRRWLTSLTYRSDHLILTNSKRGKGSKYQINNAFDIDVSEKINEVAQNPVNAVLDAAIEYPAVERPTAGLASETQEKLFDHQALKLAGAYVSVKLHTMNRVLEAYNKAPVSDEMRDSLMILVPHSPGQKVDSEKVLQIRDDSFRQIEMLLDDDNLLLELIDELEADNPVTDFIEYLYDQLESEDDRQLFKRLMRAQHAPVTTHSGAYGSIRTQDGMMIVDKDDRIIWPIWQNGKYVHRLPEVEHPAPPELADEPSVSSPEPIIELDTLVYFAAPKEPIAPVEYLPYQEGSKDLSTQQGLLPTIDESINPKLRPHYTKLRDDVLNCLQAMDELGFVVMKGEEISLNQLKRNFSGRFGTRQSRERLSKVGIELTGAVGHTLEQAVLVYVFNANKHLLSHKQFQPAAIGFISKMVERFLPKDEYNERRRKNS